MPVSKIVNTLYAVWGTDTDGTVMLLGITQDARIAVMIANESKWADVAIDARKATVAGLRGFFDVGGRPILKTPLTRGQLVDLMADSERLAAAQLARPAPGGESWAAYTARRAGQEAEEDATGQAPAYDPEAERS
jgi:hypothetical protein